MKFHRLYKESDAPVDIKKLLKLNGVTKLPAGTKFSGTKASWEKHKGHAGSNTIHKMCIQLEHAGWKKGDWTTGGIPDGSSVANSRTYTSPDGKILMSYTEYYGCTSYDNSFYITFKLAESPVNESNDDFDDYDEEIDYCVQYAKDAIDRILNQPGIDDFILSRRGKIPVPLKALLPYEGGTPDEELVEAICNRCSNDKIKVTGYGSGWTLIFPDIANQMNESDEWDDWNDGVPKVYKYHSDDPISPKEFVSIVRSTEHTVEDIFIQNSDFYENADDPWEEFVNDMCQGKSPEEALDLDYYMNSSAQEQLPDDIAKYVYANDFDAMQWLRGIFERLMPICKDTVNESEIKGTGRVDFDDDLVAVYTPDGKLEYKGLFDDCPYKDEPMQYDRKNMVYRFEGENGDYRTMVKIAESKVNEASRFGFEVGDKVELKSDVEPNRFSDRGVVPAGTVGEVVATDKPMRGVIKVKIEDGTVVSVPERKLKFAGTDNEPWEKFNKQPEKPPREPSEEDLLHARPEWIYMEPPKPGYPKWTGD